MMYFVCNMKRKPDGSTEYFPHGIIEFNGDILVAQGIAVDLCQDFFAGKSKKFSYVIPENSQDIIELMRKLYENEYFAIIQRNDVQNGFMHKPSFSNAIPTTMYNIVTLQKVN